MNDRTAEVVRLLKEGYTAKEIQKAVGYNSVSNVYRIAKDNGLKAKHICKERPQCNKTEWICEWCGKEFTPTKKDERIKFCSVDCQRKDSRARLRDESIINDESGRQFMETHSTNWEYVGGYINSERHLTVRCKVCGTEKEFAAVSFRGDEDPACTECERIKRTEQKAKAKRLEKELKRFNRKPKPIKVQTFKTCEHCGGFYFGRGKFCSEECRRVSLNHYYSMKNDRRRKKARTEESKSISIQALFTRDNGICWICGGKCDMNADTNSNEYPSIDHVVPVSCGGKDEWDNVRLAHRWCNSKRGNREKMLFISTPGVD